MLERMLPPSFRSPRQATARSRSGPKKSCKLPRNRITAWPMPVPWEFNLQAEAGRGRAPACSVPRAGASGRWGGETHGHLGQLRSSEETLPGDWWSHHRRGVLGGGPSESPCQSHGRVVPSLALPMRSTTMRLKGCVVLGGGGGRWGRRRDGVCLTSGFNLKHMHWPKFILPA